MTLFTGLSAFPLTPTTAGGDLDARRLETFLDGIAGAGVDSVGLLGSTGGYPYLTPDERKEVLRVAKDSVAGRVPIIVSVGALRTDVAEDLARDAKAAGADGLLLAPVSYQPLTEEEVFRHFEAVAHAGDLPLCIYNNPGTTKFTFSDALIERLARIPAVQAVKMPPLADDGFAGQMDRLSAMTPEGFAIGHSGDWGAKEALLAGAACWYSVAAGLLPEQAVALTRAAQAGDRAEAERIDLAFQPLWSLFRRFGSYRVMFTMAELLGHGQLRPPRPVLPLPEEERVSVNEALESVTAIRPA